jgi:hypothetical protein
VLTQRGSVHNARTLTYDMGAPVTGRGCSVSLRSRHVWGVRPTHGCWPTFRFGVSHVWGARPSRRRSPAFRFDPVFLHIPTSTSVIEHPELQLSLSTRSGSRSLYSLNTQLRKSAPSTEASITGSLGRLPSRCERTGSCRLHTQSRRYP